MKSEDRIPKIFKIQPTSGRLKETQIAVTPYEMYETELLDRSIMSLTKTEEAFVDVNNKVIDSINQRKNRLNTINTRIQNLS